MLEGVGGKADEIEVTLHEVEDQSLPGDLLVLGGHVVLPFCLAGLLRLCPDKTHSLIELSKIFIPGIDS